MLSEDFIHMAVNQFMIRLLDLLKIYPIKYPLVYGQGNFGNIDGDNAAAMRYTEAKLTSVAGALLKDIECDTVSLKKTSTANLRNQKYCHHNS